MKNILIIEDEEKVIPVIKAYLEKSGYNVFIALNGLTGIKVFKENKFDLIILDLMLPDISGEDICKIIRETSDVYIFMLTAKGSLEDKIDGLNVGADEYLVKPFSPRELTARVNALFRRFNNISSQTLIFDSDNLVINNDERSVKVKDIEVMLTANEFDILYTLAFNKGIVLTREQLIQKIFGLDFDGSDRTVDVHIKNLRKKIEVDSKNPRYIITVVKIGYKFGEGN
jgi:DNA-binding response OmpR family regulator